MNEDILFGLLTQALATGGAVWAAIRVEIRALWRESDLNRERVERMEDRINRVG